MELNTRIEELDRGVEEFLEEMLCSLNAAINKLASEGHLGSWRMPRELIMPHCIWPTQLWFGGIEGLWTLKKIPDYLDQEALFAFMNGLQNWVKMEIERRGAQELAMAISIVESLIEFRKSDKSKNDTKTHKGKSGGEPPKHKKGGSKKWKSKETTSKGDRPRKFDRPRDRPPLKCFLCDGPHRVRECPKRNTLSALVGNREARPH
ncbi:hypothetical protein GH714_040416 [Hevea brasiliensis]|uniref:Uncharacterized protein n=1 Tax=Hevea brasiliensis TaxID=3981 RepID=A0A6A6M713_HEVBR|nr:hypothetical protein GH714_040416 [Hevea brasiliensis]